MKQIWIVDDEADFRMLIQTMLKKEGFNVRQVESGEQCLELLDSGEVADLILLDVMMPGIDGWEVCRRIKKNRAISMVPVCMLTAKTKPYDVHVSLNKVNANWHLNKPVNKDKLLEAVNWLLESVLYKKT
ncbi:transcriptional regulatory protein AfsQ1 [archaeon BMS3Abin16]|nr:transcriptional regulatory protein AfsQ1 [archaeon BMS3Abin16]HDY74178.1 response regulator [Euryarchaeota archaeon]